MLPYSLLISVLSAVALIAVGLGLWFTADDLRWEPEVLIPLSLLGVLGVLLRERDLGPHVGVSVATVVLAAAIPLAGPHGAALVGLLSYAADVRQRTATTRLFNAVMAAAVGGLGGLTYLALGGGLVPHEDPYPWELLVEVGVPLLAAYAVMTLVNAWSIGAMSAVVRSTKVLDVTLRVLRSAGWGYLSHVVVGFLFVVLWGPVRLGALAALFIIGPLVVAHWTIGRAVLARREHEETVASFVAALEHADPASVGHSARVADLAELVGSELGVRGRGAEELRYAALLHDIGLVLVRAQMPADPTTQETDYLSALSAHPEAGTTALAGLDFLTGALPAIAHHHERVDGRGYPAGLTGEDIPLGARIIAAADAYDSLTVGAGPQVLDPVEAVAALKARAGSHLDPVVVEALAATLPRLQGRSRRVGRAAVSVPGGRDAGPSADRERTLPDHDHPRLSDSFAHWQPEHAGQGGTPRSGRARRRGPSRSAAAERS